MKKKVQSIRLAPFSKKYRGYYEKTKTCRINCLEGSVRSGKTILNICAFVNYIDSCRGDNLFVASSKTGGLAKTTVGECKGATSADGQYGAAEGFGLIYMFKGRCKEGSYGRIPCLFVNTLAGGKASVIFVGAYNKNAKESLRGLTVKGWLATELYNHRVDDDDDFIAAMFDRMLLGETKCFLDMNPTYPTHKVYKKYLDEYAEHGCEGDYNYLHCTLEDNAILPASEVERTKRKSGNPNSVQYKRDILGQRAASSGLIFSQFAVEKDRWVIENLQDFVKSHSLDKIRIGVDFGDNKSATTFVASSTYDNKKGVIILASAKLDMQNGTLDTRAVKDEFKRFFKGVLALKVGNPFVVYCDCADNVLTNEIRNAVKELALQVTCLVKPCMKKPVRLRIDCKNQLINYEKWFVYKGAITVIESTESQVYDTRDGHEDERLDNGTCDVDTADAEEYSWEIDLEILSKSCV